MWLDTWNEVRAGTGPSTFAGKVGRVFGGAVSALMSGTMTVAVWMLRGSPLPKRPLDAVPQQKSWLAALIPQAAARVLRP